MIVLRLVDRRNGKTVGDVLRLTDGGKFLIVKTEKGEEVVALTPKLRLFHDIIKVNTRFSGQQ